MSAGPGSAAAPPDFRTAEADELIAGQYADRPQLRLVDVDPSLVEEAMRPGRRLVARIRLTDPRGNPVCARVHPPALTWSAEPARGQSG